MNLLKDFDKMKIYNDEVFKFSTYPNIIPYKYVVSNYGRVFIFIKCKEIKYHFDKDGYVMGSIQILLNNKKVSRTVGIHRLVAWDYCKHISGKNLVNHKDGIKTDNYYENLEWCTPAENTRHAIKHGLQVNSGVNCASAVYSETIIRDICSKLENGMDVYSIYKIYYPESTVSEHREFYQEIFSIRDGTRHLEISRQYDISRDDTISKVKERFSENDINNILSQLYAGKTNIEILRSFGFVNKRESKKSRRYYDKITILRKKINTQ